MIEADAREYILVTKGLRSFLNDNPVFNSMDFQLTLGKSRGEASAMISAMYAMGIVQKNGRNFQVVSDHLWDWRSIK